MKKAAVAVAVLVFAALMVLPVVRSVNLSAGKPVTIERTLPAYGWHQPPLSPQPRSMDATTLVADGSPIPPFPPSVRQTLVADGSPIPPFPPSARQTLVADGSPIPPFPPSVRQTLVADGSPIPPFPPRSPQARFAA
jgi:hypothetical protein